MVDIRECLLQARVEQVALEAWIKAGWVTPRVDEAGQRFTEIDIARVCLIRDLRDDVGVNEDGIPVVLDLLDQIHGLRLALRRMASAIDGLPGTAREEAVAVLRGLTAGRPAR
ncbi:MAG TPA: chaperone modulator CbpM [Roseomonas sp.]|jgi:chaperone modulatory protein CbpM